MFNVSLRYGIKISVTRYNKVTWILNENAHRSVCLLGLLVFFSFLRGQPLFQKTGTPYMVRRQHAVARYRLQSRLGMQVCKCAAIEARSEASARSRGMPLLLAPFRGTLRRKNLGWRGASQLYAVRSDVVAGVRPFGTASPFASRPVRPSFLAARFRAGRPDKGPGGHAVMGSALPDFFFSILPIKTLPIGESCGQTNTKPRPSWDARPLFGGRYPSDPGWRVGDLVEWVHLLLGMPSPYTTDLV